VIQSRVQLAVECESLVCFVNAFQRASGARYAVLCEQHSTVLPLLLYGEKVSSCTVPCLGWVATLRVTSRYVVSACETREVRLEAYGAAARCLQVACSTSMVHVSGGKHILGAMT
jgi:hypothetical protein